MMHGYFWCGMWIFPIIMIMVFLVVLFFIFGRGSFRLPWQDYGSYGENREPETALEILKKRYAKGEINKEEFEQMKKRLL